MKDTPRHVASTDQPAPALPALDIALFDVDVGSPNGARWIDETGDRLAADVRRALEFLQSEVTLQPPSGEVRQMLCMQTEDRDSPSLIWTAQAVGSLLELGFTPESQCVKDQLDVIALSLDERNWRSPYEDGLGAPWVIRARHMAWILGCLAEFQPPAVPTTSGARLASAAGADGDGAPGTTVQKTLPELIGLAYDGLVGSPQKSSPAQWIAPRRSSRGSPGHDTPQLSWDEGWPVPGRRPPKQKLERRKNLLTTLYAVISICRAERHGYRRDEDAWQAVVRDEQPASVLVQNLITQIQVEPAVDGPTVTLKGEWLEPWANAHTLPTSVIGLLALALVEYTRFLAGIIKPEPAERRLVHGAFLKAQRLAESLLARPRFMDTSWSRGIDAFFQKGAKGTWFVPSCSVCLRAVLETGVADPTHPLARDAIDTLGLLEINPAEGGWLDPAYHTGMDDEARAKAATTGLTRRGHPQRLPEPSGLGLEHAEMDLRVALDRRTKPGDHGGWKATPASVYGAALALSAVRRAWSRADPRTLPTSPRSLTGAAKPPARLLGASAFDEIRIEGQWPPYEVKLLRDDNSYREDTRLIHRGTHDLLQALSLRGTATPGELQKVMREIRCKEKGPAATEEGEQALDRPAAIASRIDKTNLFFGFQLIESLPAKQGTEMRYRISDSTRLIVETT